jgi:hypothetical protein
MLVLQCRSSFHASAAVITANNLQLLYLLAHSYVRVVIALGKSLLMQAAVVATRTAHLR